MILHATQGIPKAWFPQVWPVKTCIIRNATLGGVSNIQNVKSALGTPHVGGAQMGKLVIVGLILIPGAVISCFITTRLYLRRISVRSRMRRVGRCRCKLIRRVWKSIFGLLCRELEN